jgi:hypothetical protein
VAEDHPVGVSRHHPGLFIVAHEIGQVRDVADTQRVFPTIDAAVSRAR